MPIVINTTISGPDANSYVTESYATDYWANHYNTAKIASWAALTSGQKIALLLAACRVIESIRFVDSSKNYSAYKYFFDRNTGTARPIYPGDSPPVRYDFYQRLQFPRNLDVTAAGATYIPDDVKVAQCEQALSLYTIDTSTIVNSMQGLTAESVRIGNISISQKFSSGTLGTVLSIDALQSLNPYILRTNRVRRG